MNCRNEAYIACDLSADFQSSEWYEKGRLAAVGKERNTSTDHCTVEVWFVALGCVCHEGELGYAKDFALYIFDICLPHVTRGIGEHFQR